MYKEAIFKNSIEIMSRRIVKKKSSFVGDLLPLIYDKLSYFFKTRALFGWIMTVFTILPTPLIFYNPQFTILPEISNPHLLLTRPHYNSNLEGIRLFRVLVWGLYKPRENGKRAPKIRILGISYPLLVRWHTSPKLLKSLISSSLASHDTLE